MAIDSHCHLDRPSFGDEVEAVLRRARAAGLRALVTIGAGSTEAGEAATLAAAHPDVYFACGVHPHDARHATPDLHAHHARLLGGTRAVALGEIGLDYHYLHSPAEVQRAVFAEQLGLARQLALPVVVHLREATADGLALLDLEYRGGPGVIHCFTGGWDEARAFLERGLYLSVPGVVTFKKAEALRQAAARIPADRLLVETDAPYLAPVPHRGQRNEPAFVLETLRCLADLRRTSPEELAAVTAANACRLFGLTLDAAPR